MRVRRGKGGFTLFEVILSITIFVLLATGIFFSVSAATRAASELGRAQIDSRKLTSFVKFLRQGFHNVSPQAQIQLRSRSIGQSSKALDLVVLQAGAAFGGELIAGGGSTVILSVQPHGRESDFTLTRLSTAFAGAELDKKLQTAIWLPLLNDVQSVRWRFWDPNLRKYVELWEAGELPPLIELTFQVAGGPSETYVFSVPKLAK